MVKKKYYAVRKGLKVGVFETWDECKASVNGYSGAEYKSFSSLKEAQAFACVGVTDNSLSKGCENLKETECCVVQNKLNRENEFEEDIVEIYVDGSYLRDTNEFSYGMVIITPEGEQCFSEKFSDEELAAMNNVAGEIKGAEAAMRYAVSNDIKHIRIYHDYEGIAKWCTGAWKANKSGTKKYRDFYDSLSGKLQVDFVKVKGHSNDKYNDMADKLAKEALGI